MKRARAQLKVHLPDVVFLPTATGWADPDPGHLRLQLPIPNFFGRPMQRCLDVRVRYSSLLNKSRGLSGSKTRIGCWSFTEAELLAFTDYWLLVLASGSQPLVFVLPQHRVRALLESPELQFCIQATASGQCMANSGPYHAHDKAGQQVAFNDPHDWFVREVRLFLNNWQLLDGTASEYPS